MTRRGGRASTHRSRAASSSPLPHRRLVLDATAVDAFRSTRAEDRRRSEVLLAIAAADGGTTVPTSVRVETGWDRRAAAWSNANRLVPTDDALDAPAADLAAATRDPGAEAASGRAPSLADRHVAVAAHRATGPRGGGHRIIEVLTADVDDVRTVLDRLPPTTHPIEVRPLEG